MTDRQIERLKKKLNRITEQKRKEIVKEKIKNISKYLTNVDINIYDPSEIRLDISSFSLALLEYLDTQKKSIYITNDKLIKVIENENPFDMNDLYDSIFDEKARNSVEKLEYKYEKKLEVLEQELSELNDNLEDMVEDYIDEIINDDTVDMELLVKNFLKTIDKIK